MTRSIYITLVLALLFAASCTKHIGPGIDQSKESFISPGITRSTVDAAVWNEDLKMFLFPYEDKSALSVFQDAYDKLARERSEDGFTLGLKLKPTHHALVIRPKSEQQQRSIEQNGQLIVRYIPFGYEGYNSFSASVLDGEEENESEGCCIETGTQDSVIIPDLYVYWPVSLDIPRSIDYEEAYPVFIPGSANDSGNDLSADVLASLEDEVFHPLQNRSGGRLCQLSMWDSLLCDYVPVPRARIEIHPASTYVDTTDDNGYFHVPANQNWGYVYAVLRSSNWVITVNYSTAALITSIGAVGLLNDSPADVAQIQLPSTSTFTAHRAANAFFHENHQLSCWNPQDFNQIRIAIVDTVVHNTGHFYGYENPPFIQIRPGRHKSRFFTTIHELGHYAHYCRLGRDTYISRRESSIWYRLIIESFASFVGWHVGRVHYFSQGYVPPSPNTNFTKQAHQDWDFTSTQHSSIYSPLFVDIIDDYNQSIQNPALIDDPINFAYGYPLVRQIIDDCTTLNSVSTKIHQFDAQIGATAIENYLGYYYFWYYQNQ